MAFKKPVAKGGAKRDLKSGKSQASKPKSSQAKSGKSKPASLKMGKATKSKTGKAKSGATKPKVTAKAKPKAKAKAKAAPAKATAKKAGAKANAKKAGSSKPTVATGGKRASHGFGPAFRPLDNRVLVEPQGKSERTSGGLYIPDSVQERPNQGRVLAVGPGARSKKGLLRPLDVRPGEEVLYAQHTGVTIELDGRSLLLLKESEILGVVR